MTPQSKSHTRAQEVIRKLGEGILNRFVESVKEEPLNAKKDEAEEIEEESKRDPNLYLTSPQQLAKVT